MEQLNFKIRPEEARDYEAVLLLTYEAFMTLDYPGRMRMDEHYLIALLQDSDRAIEGLRFVAEYQGRLIGHIFYARTAFRRPDGTHAETATFGPLSVLPEYHGQGVGRTLVSHTLAIVRAMGFGGILITGVEAYYPKLGFRRGREYGVTMSDGTAPDALMVYELKPGYFSGGGVFDTWPSEYDRAEQDDMGYHAFHTAFARKHFPKAVTFRPLFEQDIARIRKWLSAPHVAKWYQDPDDWIRELEERRGAFSFLTHLIAEYEGIAFGFCQYYDCYDAQEHEVWDEQWHVGEHRGEVYSLDYLIGETGYLQRGFGKTMIMEMVSRVEKLGAKTMIVQPEADNEPSCRTLLSCGFQKQGDAYVLTQSDIDSVNLSIKE